VEFGFVFILKTKLLLPLNLFERRDLMSLFRALGWNIKCEVSQLALLSNFMRQQRGLASVVATTATCQGLSVC
jgi:hypothetical protein